MPSNDEANGVDLCTEVFGDPADPPILLIMGVGASMIWWEEGLLRCSPATRVGSSSAMTTATRDARLPVCPARRVHGGGPDG